MVEMGGEAEMRQGRMRLAMVLLARRRAGAFMLLCVGLICLFGVGWWDNGIDGEMDKLLSERWHT